MLFCYEIDDPVVNDYRKYINLETNTSSIAPLVPHCLSFFHIKIKNITK